MIICLNVGRSLAYFCARMRSLSNAFAVSKPFVLDSLIVVCVCFFTRLNVLFDIDIISEEFETKIGFAK